MGADQTEKTQVFPAFPDFVETAIPYDVFLTKKTSFGPLKRRVTPSHAYLGRIQPFESNGDALSVSRMLVADTSISVHGGYLLSDERAESLPATSVDPRLYDLMTAFEVMVLTFEHTIDPWVFSLAPEITALQVPMNPHLRGDRELIWNGKTLHGLCVYSAAEFFLTGHSCPMTEFLRQVSIYFGKYLFWQATIPKTWPGRVALSGLSHLKLDPNGPCWCGDGLRHKECCLPGEVLTVLRRVRGFTLPTGALTL
jgi:hypothetical protein